MPNLFRFLMSTVQTSIRIGRKPAHVHLDVIKEEIKRERSMLGDEAFVQRLNREEKILAEFEDIKKEHQRLVSKCTETIFKGVQQRTLPFGTFWKSQQAIVNRDSSLEDRKLLNEHIDWLKSRQILASEDLLLRDYIQPFGPSSRSC